MYYKLIKTFLENKNSSQNGNRDRKSKINEKIKEVECEVLGLNVTFYYFNRKLFFNYTIKTLRLFFTVEIFFL